MDFPVGVMLGGADLDANLARAAATGSEIVQIWCTRGELAPENFTPQRAKSVLKRCDMLGLRISALCGDTGLGFTDGEKGEQAVAKTLAYVEVCRDLGVPVLTSHIGHLSNPEQIKVGVELLRKVGDAAERCGVTFASETGLEDGPPLRAFLEDVAHPRIKVNFDPANLTMRGFDLELCVRLLGPHIAHSHAKDGLAGGGEVPIGAGDVPWPEYLTWLRRAGYTGPLAVEREGGDQWWTDVEQACRLIKAWR